MKRGERHQCPIDGCFEAVPEERLMCLRHWFRVQDEQKRAIWSSFRAMCKAMHSGKSTPDEEIAAIRAYQEQRELAIEAVNALERRPG